MAVPPRRRSKSRTRIQRRVADRKSMPGITYCPSCNAPKQPHRACGTCGFYDARHGKIIETGFSADGAES